MQQQCQVCFTPAEQRFTLPALGTGNGEVLRRADNCTTKDHVFCVACVEQFVKSRVADLRVADLRCPFPECATRLYDTDVARVLSKDAETLARYRELIKADFSGKLEATLQSVEDIESLHMLAQCGIKLCPSCGCLLQRSTGCNSFYCVCGNHFDFQSAKGVISKEMQNVIKVARLTGLPLDEARAFRGSLRALRRANSVLDAFGRDNMTLAAARELADRAFRGDAEARAQIRQAREQRRTVQVAPKTDVPAPTPAPVAAATQ